MVVALLVVLVLGWGWAVLCWTVRDLHQRTAEALAQAQRLNQELARRLWAAETAREPARAASAAHLESVGQGPILPKPHLDDLRAFDVERVM